MPDEKYLFPEQEFCFNWRSIECYSNFIFCNICFFIFLTKKGFIICKVKSLTHSCQSSRINREAHGFGKFFRISHKLDKSQGFSRNTRFFLKEIPKLYKYAVLYIPQLLSVLSIFVFVAFRCCSIVLTFSHSFVVSNLIYPRAAKYFSGCSWLFIKPGMQERGTECGECGERGECSIGFRGMLLF